jgi:hypothetical protein
MGSFKTRGLICPVCERVCANLADARACAAQRIPAFPVIERSSRYRLSPDVFNELYPNRPANDNVFNVSGKLLGSALNRIPNCVIRFDKKNMVHRYKIRLHWLGNEENIRVERTAWAWFDDLEKIVGGEN